MTYENLTDMRLEIPGVGVCEPHGEIETDQIIENPHLRLKDGSAQPQEPANQQTSEPANPPAEKPENHEGGTE